MILDSSTLSQDLAEFGLTSSRDDATPKGSEAQGLPSPAGSAFARGLVGYKAPKSTSKPKPFKDPSTHGRGKLEMDLEVFRASGEGSRNAQFFNLALRGISGTLKGWYFPGEFQGILYRAADDNGYLADEGRSNVDAQWASAEEVVAQKHDSKWSSREGGSVPNPSTSIVSPLLSQTSVLDPATEIAEQIYNSNHSSSHKAVGYYMLAWFVKHRYIAAKYSARTAAPSAGVSKDTANRALKALAEDPSINIEILSQGHGTDEPGLMGKTNVFILKLDTLSDEPLANPSVDLRIYAERTQRSDSYIEETQSNNRAVRREYVKNQETSTAREPAPVHPPRVSKPKPSTQPKPRSEKLPESLSEPSKMGASRDRQPMIEDLRLKRQWDNYLSGGSYLPPGKTFEQFRAYQQKADSL